MDASLPDAELERLLTQLVRMLDPSPAGKEQVGGQGHVAGVADGAGARAGRGADGAAERAVPPPVSASEARALIELVAAQGIAQGQLAALLGLEKSTVSRLAAGLERKGWVTRGRDGDSHRYVRLSLTPAGEAVAHQMWDVWQARQARILGSLTPQERAGLTAGLRGLLRGLASEGLLTAPAQDA